MMAKTELSVTLSPALYDHLIAEATLLGVELEWLIASLVVDTHETCAPESETADALQAEPDRRERVSRGRSGRKAPWRAAAPSGPGATLYANA